MHRMCSQRIALMRAQSAMVQSKRAAGLLTAGRNALRDAASGFGAAAGKGLGPLHAHGHLHAPKGRCWLAGMLLGRHQVDGADQRQGIVALNLVQKPPVRDL
eukprot:scaffold347356_cov16-Prasinocladus_malaysianus.AAC.2